MGPSSKGIGGDGPTKLYPYKMNTDSSEQFKQEAINTNQHITEQPTQTPSQHIMMELPNPLKESLDKIYQGLEGIAKYIVGVEKKADEALQRVGGLEERMKNAEERLEQHEKRLTGIENEFNNFKEYVEEEFDKVNNRLDNVGGALDTLANAIRKIPVTYNKLVKVEPGSPEGLPFETEDGEVKWYKIVTVHNEAGNYKPIESILSKFNEYRKGI